MVTLSFKSILAREKSARRMIDVEDTAIETKTTISEAGVADDHCTPDTVSPAQFHELWCGTQERSAEFKLALAVLEQAVEDLQRHRGAIAPEPQRLYVQARRWVASNDRRWPYSFANVDLRDEAPLEEELRRLARA